ncbi:MAG: TetR/AcrR family transcriptional regulator, partial [Solobacterium sp.]|nr:TetR/AcrR family transcriptional regulator [Solobacterium sp.]
MADHQDNDRRNEFIAAAEKLFRENGIVDTTISSIVKEVNVAKGLFYYYFNSKEDVIDAVSEKYREIFRAHVQQKAEEQDYDERLAHFVENGTASFTELWNKVGVKDMSPLSQKRVDDAN